MKYFILIVFAFSVISCKTPKFYDEIKSTYDSYDVLVVKYGKESVRRSTYDAHKLVMKKLSPYLQNSDHIIYHFSPASKWKGREFSGAVYDVDNKKYYYVNNHSGSSEIVHVDTVYKYPEENYYKFIIDNYREGKIEYLKELGEKSNHSGIRTWEVIYDVDLRSGVEQKHTFRDFLFIDNKPLQDIEF